jgi:hypothetical protein
MRRAERPVPSRNLAHKLRTTMTAEEEDTAETHLLRRPHCMPYKHAQAPTAGRGARYRKGSGYERRKVAKLAAACGVS